MLFVGYFDTSFFQSRSCQCHSVIVLGIGPSLLSWILRHSPPPSYRSTKSAILSFHRRNNIMKPNINSILHMIVCEVKLTSLNIHYCAVGRSAICRYCYFSLHIRFYISFPLHPSTISSRYALLDVKIMEQMQTFEGSVVVGAMSYVSPSLLLKFLND